MNFVVFHFPQHRCIRKYIKYVTGNNISHVTYTVVSYICTYISWLLCLIKHRAELIALRRCTWLLRLAYWYCSSSSRILYFFLIACNSSCTGLNQCYGPTASECCNFNDVGNCTDECGMNKEVNSTFHCVCSNFWTGDSCDSKYVCIKWLYAYVTSQ